MDDEERRALEQLESDLGHRFTDRGWLVQALTHRSFRHESGTSVLDNERLEFLGDAVVNLAASIALWSRFPDATEGELTRRRAALVSEPRLAALARTLEIGQALRVGKGEGRSGGRDKDSLLGDAVEAVIASVYADAGLERAIQIATELLIPRIEEIMGAREDFKSLVQQRVQAGGGDPPRYRVVATDGPDHDRRFHVEIMIEGVCRGRGEGRSKKEAEQAAAEEALRSMSLDGAGDGSAASSDAPSDAPAAVPDPDGGAPPELPR